MPSARRRVDASTRQRPADDRGDAVGDRADRRPGQRRRLRCGQAATRSSTTSATASAKRIALVVTGRDDAQRVGVARHAPRQGRERRCRAGGRPRRPHASVRRTRTGNARSCWRTGRDHDDAGQASRRARRCRRASAPGCRSDQSTSRTAAQATRTSTPDRPQFSCWPKRHAQRLGFSAPGDACAGRRDAVELRRRAQHDDVGRCRSRSPTTPPGPA